MGFLRRPQNLKKIFVELLTSASCSVFSAHVLNFTATVLYSKIILFLSYWNLPVRLLCYLKFQTSQHWAVSSYFSLSSYFCQLQKFKTCAPNSTCQKADKDFLNQMWSSCIIQTLMPKVPTMPLIGQWRLKSMVCNMYCKS